MIRYALVAAGCDRARWGEFRSMRGAAFASAIAWTAVVCFAGRQSALAQHPIPPVTVEPPPASHLSRPEELHPPVQRGPLALADLEQMALAGNPAVTRAAALVGAARGNWLQVGLPPNPTVGYEGQQIGSGGLAEQHGIAISQEIVRGGKLRLNRAVAEQELARAEQDLAAQQQRVLTDVRIAFYDVLLAQRQIDLTENLVRISREGAAAVDMLLKIKEASRPDVLQAQLEVENAQVLARNARNRHDAAWQRLSAVVGNPNLPQQPLAGDAFAPPQEIDFQQTLARLQTASPEIGRAFTEISRARAALDRARAEPIPNFDVQGLVNVVDNGVGGKANAGIVFSMPIPVFDQNQGAILKARHEIAAAEQALQQLELDFQSRLAPTYERYANARNQIERYREAILPAADETLNITRQLYEVGEATFLSLLTAQRTYSQTNLNYLDALRELRTAEAEINGLMLRDSLANY